MEQNIKDQLNLFVVGIHASHLALQEREAAQKMKEISSQKCLELFKLSNQDGLFAKMLLDTLTLVSTKLPHHWKLKDTPCKRLYFQLQPLTHHIDGIESGLWATPTTQEAEHLNMEVNEKGRRISKDGLNSHSLSLADQVQMYPTPTKSEHKYRLKGNTQASKCLNAKAGGKLNPAWVEWLMGYPEGWTDWAR